MAKVPAARFFHFGNRVMNQPTAGRARVGIALLSAYLADLHQGIRRITGVLSAPVSELWIGLTKTRNTARVRAFPGVIGAAISAGRRVGQARHKPRATGFRRWKSL